MQRSLKEFKVNMKVCKMKIKVLIFCRQFDMLKLWQTLLKVELFTRMELINLAWDTWVNIRINVLRK